MTLLSLVPVCISGSRKWKKGSIFTDVFMSHADFRAFTMFLLLMTYMTVCLRMSYVKLFAGLLIGYQTIPYVSGLLYESRNLRIARSLRIEGWPHGVAGLIVTMSIGYDSLVLVGFFFGWIMNDIQRDDWMNVSMYSTQSLALKKEESILTG